MEELISVIIPIYNGEKFIKCITDALQKQTYTNLEIIVIDDGSKDDSLRLCHQLMDSDERFHIFHKENGGVSAARNYGKEKAMGKYIAFIDVDDYIFPDYFAYLHELIRKYDADMSCCNYYKMWDTEKIPSLKYDEKEIVFTAEESLQDFLYNKSITGYPFLKLYRKDIVDQIVFPTNMHYGEDIFFNFHALQKCRSVVYGTKALYIYIQNDLSATHNFNYEKLCVAWEMMKKDVEEYVKNNQCLVLSAYSRLFFIAVFYCSNIEKRSEREELKVELLDAIKQYGKIVVKDNNCKKIIRIMSFIGCISPKLLVHLCEVNKFFRRKFRIANRRSI